MVSLPDKLSRPLGQGTPVRGRRSPWLGPVVTATGIAAGAGLGVFAVTALYGDPRGGRPVATVEITAPAIPESIPEPARPSREPRRDAGTVETESGVRVVRGDGAEPPPSVVVRVPDAPRTLPLAPDPRLAEQTRFGLLPRIGLDGARAVDVYAAPSRELPGGRAPAGRIAIVVGGVGLSRGATEGAISRLPPAVTLALTPYGSELASDARRAREAGHEIMLQVPMEPFDYPDSDPGPRTLTTSARPEENAENLRWALGRVVGYVGLVSYMGGKLTSTDAALAPVLGEARERGLGVLDDGSSSRSRILALASDVRAGRADVVLDGVPRADLVDAALSRLEAIALSGKLAVGSASALPLTVDRIVRWAETLEPRGILLVPASSALAVRQRETAGR